MDVFPLKYGGSFQFANFCMFTRPATPHFSHVFPGLPIKAYRKIPRLPHLGVILRDRLIGDGLPGRDLAQTPALRLISWGFDDSTGLSVVF